MIYISDIAKQRVEEIIAKEKLTPDYFVRVSVTSGGCSGLTYNMDFDNESRPKDQVFEDKGIKIVTDTKSFLYLFDTILEFSGVFKAKDFILKIPMPAGLVAVGRVLRYNANEVKSSVG